jgi:hypothetical protein
MASAIIRLTKPPTINATGSTKVVARENLDVGEDSGSGRFPIASARDRAKNMKLTRAVFRRVFDVLSSLSARCGSDAWVARSVLNRISASMPVKIMPVKAIINPFVEIRSLSSSTPDADTMEPRCKRKR